MKPGPRATAPASHHANPTAGSAATALHHGTVHEASHTLITDRAITVVPRAPTSFAALPAEMQNKRLRTVEDVHQFFQYFLQSGGLPPFKFVYCAKLDTGLKFRPYDIVVVPRGEQPPNHFVVSTQAVVHVQPGHLTEVVLMDDWRRQAAVYDKLIKLKFFRDYLLLKQLRRWRRNVNAGVYQQARTRLGKRLFLSKNTFAAATLEARKIAFALRQVQPTEASGKIPNPSDNEDAETIYQAARLNRVGYPARLVYYPMHRPTWGYTTEAFLDVQRAHASKVSGAMGMAIDAINRVLQDVVTGVASRAAVPDMQSLEELEAFVSKNSTVRGELGVIVKNERDAEKQARKRELKRCIIEYDMLQAWVRMIDFMAQEELFYNATTTLKTARKHLELPGNGSHKDLRWSLEVTLLFKDEEPIAFQPNEAAVEQFLRSWISETVDRISRIPRVVEIRDLRCHFYSAPQSTALTHVLGRDVAFNSYIEGIIQTVKKDYADAADKCRIYEPFRAVIAFCNVEWPSVYSQWQTRATEKLGSETALTEVDIKMYIGKVAKCRSELQKLQNRYVGCLSIFIDPLRSSLMSKLEAVMGDIKSIMSTMINVRATTLAKELDAALVTLKPPAADKDSAELRLYCEWLERCNTVENNARRLEDACSELTRLFHIADDHSFDLSHLKDKRDRTIGFGRGGDPSLSQQFADARGTANGFREAHRQDIARQLTDNIYHTCGVLTNLTEELKHGEYREASHTSSLILSKLQGVSNTLQSLRVKQATLNHYCDLIGVQHPSWQEMQVATETYDRKQDLWSTVARWEERRAFWNRTPVSSLEGSKVQEEMLELFQKAHKLHKLEGDAVTDRLYNAVSVEKVNLPVMVELCNPALKDEHWVKIFDGLGKKLPPAEARTLETLRTFGAYQQFELISQISAVATGEYTLLNQVNKIAASWDTTAFVLAKGKDPKKESYILGGVDDLLLQLEDQQVQIQTCMASRYVGGIKALVEEWDVKLRTIFDVVNEWVNVQKSWMYLEFIFSSDDIKKQLPEESKMFSQVDKVYRTLMTSAATTNNVAHVCLQENLLESLQQATMNLDRIQKRLEDYLETKRAAFPRFYFLSNDELLSILSDVRNPEAVQPHMQKCFDGIKALVFENPTSITAMRSTEGEKVGFTEKIRVVGNVENWLCDIERVMRVSLYDLTKQCLEDYSTDGRTKWYFKWPAQCVGTVDQIVWTNELEDVWKAMGGGDDQALIKYLEFYKRQILDTVSLVKGQLTSNERTICGTLIVVDVHARDVVSGLIEAKCRTHDDFNWQKQLRYYWMAVGDDPRPDCHIHHSTAKCTYGYEYLGNQPRLVITPLTERAFLTCTGALHMFQGAAPQGPAGTGKTESVKDLGKALARQVVVFNCSDGLNYKMMSQMFAGLAQAGAWACFDEFNRIELEVLSVIAQQMLEISTAIAQRQTHMKFDGRHIRLHKNFGVFITMNPGYAGRTELPDNLKALFRPICMMIPDYALIAEIMFYSEGFADARSLAQKMVRLYSLASQQLSKQKHYDFGMRAVKSILVMAGALKRAEPDNPEDMILIRAMRDSNIPKFLRDDTTLFLALVSDLFPSVDIREVVNADLHAEIERTLKRNGHQVVDGFVTKILQLQETMVVRHGVMLVGETMTGKTTNEETLREALTQLHANGVHAHHEAHKRFIAPTHIHKLNPKSITMGEMYGDVHRITREWQDGVLSNIIRDLVKLTTQDRHWVCFDGPVDAIWIENMNTVLDDNKLLCLVNGERIKLEPTLSIMFEVMDLKEASPATVSRCGMVFLEPYNLDGGWKPMATSYSERIAAEGGINGIWRHERVMELLKAALPPTFHFIRTECQEYIKTVDAQLTINLLDYLKALCLNRETNDDGDDVAEANGQRRVAPAGAPDLRKLLDMYFVMAFIWSLGGNLSDKHREKFSSFARKIIVSTLFMTFPDERGTVFDYFVHTNGLCWMPWTYKVPAFKYDVNKPYFSLLVPTTDTVMLRFTIQNLASIGKHMLVNGVTGTGKSSAVANCLTDALKTEATDSKFAAFSMTFSAQTTSHNLQETLEAKLVRRRGDKELGPPVGKRLIMMVDDCNMPQLEQYGASPPIELLRQIISQGGCFDRKKLFFKDIIDLIVIMCCGEPGGGKNEMTPRLTSRAHALCIPALSALSMQTIFNGLLGGHLSTYAPAVAALAKCGVDATIEVYERIAREMLPTPEKTHYTFNLRDVSKVVQGIIQVPKKNLTTASDLVKLWVHESTRVFADRLINQTDLDWWWKCVGETVQKCFVNCGVAVDDSFRSLIFGAWGDKKSIDYKQITDEATMHDILKESMSDYNATKYKDTDLVLFDDAIQHLSRLCRILRVPRGNALLVGVGGSGRHSLCELAAHMCGMDCRGIAIVRNYGVNEFREDVRKVLIDCGCNKKNLTFLLSDTQMINTQFLEDLNNLLNIGEVPGLMGNDEHEKIASALREVVRQSGRPETRGTFYQFFVEACRERMHIVFCMSPVGASFRDRLRMFPSLVNCMTIDWYTAWPRDALLSVAQRKLAKRDLGSSQVKNAICELCVHLHLSVKKASDDMFAQLRRRNATTPTSYLSLLSLYGVILDEQSKLIDENVSRYKGGLEKLQDTAKVISDLKEKIRNMQPFLLRAAKETEEKKAQVTVEQAEADKVKAEVEVEERAARELKEEAQSMRNECQMRLDEAIPALKAAEAALDTLNKDDINVIKTFPKPPANVEKTMNAVLVLLKVDEGWANARSQLSDMGFLQTLKSYDRDNIAPGVIRKLQKFIDDKDFHPHIIRSVSSACEGLCMWVRAIHKYYHVSREVQPLKDRLKVAEDKLAKAQAELDVKQANLAQVVDRVRNLQKQARETEERKMQLENQIKEAEAKLERADQLIGGLSAERARWQDSLTQLAAQRRNLIGTMALAAGCVAYVGPFPSQFRSTLVSDWIKFAKEKNLPVDEAFLLSSLPDQYTVREWTLQSLPQDPFSIENATILQRSTRWCLMIDPQGQANTFIRNKEKKNKLRVIKLSDDNYMRSIEGAIQVGLPVLIENVGEELDASLNPILLKEVTRVNGRMVLRLGEKEVDYDPAFRLYITTKLPNPNFSPELQIKVTVINFTVTRKGLEDQLLSDIVGNERADLQERSDQCVVAIAEGKGKIKKLEDQILRMLAESTGDILDNIELIQTLRASKSTAESIAQDLAVVEATNVEIDTAREEYRSLATRGSLIYGVVADLSGVDPMYQNSLVFFKKLFIQTLNKVAHEEDEVVQKRVATLIDAVTITSYNVVCRGLFEKDKLLFAFMIAISLLRHVKTISDTEWSFFLRGAAGQAPPSGFPQCPDYLRPAQWQEFAALSQLPCFDGVPGKVLSERDAWKKWISSDTIFDDPPPGYASGAKALSEWQRLLIVKAFRPEKLSFSMRRVVLDHLGKPYTESPPFMLSDAFADSNNMTPLIFVLSTGTDPTVIFTNFAQEMGFGEKKLMLSLGQDQGKRAQAMIEEGRKDGLWVYLQNCHVYVSWMPSLERIVEQMRPEDTHPDFRLWLTSNPSPSFPVPVLQTGMKLTREPPKGLKANVRDSIHSLDVVVWNEFNAPKEGEENLLGNSAEKERSWKKLVFALAFFHALVQERRKFGALGWNIPYEWGPPDMAASIKTLREALRTAPGGGDKLPWTALQYTIGVLHYGGRVTDFLDGRCLSVLLNHIFAPSLFVENAALDPDKIYRPLEPCDKEQLLSYIDTLPVYESPGLFGLHDNANIAFQAKDSGTILQTLIDIQPRGSSSGGGKTSDEVVLELVTAMASRVPQNIEVSQAHPTTFALTDAGIMSSLGTFLAQEIDQFNYLLKVIRNSLKELTRAIKGEVVMSQTMENMFTAVLFNAVPKNWKDAGYLSLKPLASFFNDLIERVKFIDSWCTGGLPKSFWLPGFFFPQGFITSLFQTHSRKHKIPIDTVKFYFHPQQPTTNLETLPAVSSGAYVHGFFLDGASWDSERRCLEESLPGRLFTPLPPIHFEPVLLSQPAQPNTYECPLYKTSTRAGTLSTTGLSTNFVLSLFLPAGAASAEHWVRRGVAALTMLDD